MPSIYKGHFIKDTDEEVHRLRSKRALSIGASVPMGLDWAPALHVDHSPTWKLLTFCDFDAQLKLTSDVEGRGLSLASEELSINTGPSYH